MSSPRFLRLEDWLQWQQALHPSAIDMGLDRVRVVAERLNLMHGLPAVFTVGGTNGKGSVVAMLEACLLAGGHRVACYTSPHFLRYNERIRIDAQMASDEQIMQAFVAIDEARGDISLTYFEFGTLAAVWCARQAVVDVLVLEVGLGGRLDACNLWDADVSVVTSIGLDHQAYLGNTREAIAGEKAGIFRAARPAVCGDRQPPSTLIDHATAIGADLICIGRDFDAFADPDDAGRWRYQGQHSAVYPDPGLAGRHQRDNAATVLRALEAWPGWRRPEQSALARALTQVQLPGRCQRWPGAEHVVLDVAHNPQAAAMLAQWLRQHYAGGVSPVAVVAMLSDKDHEAVVRALSGLFGRWYVARLEADRAGDPAVLQSALQAAGESVSAHVHGVAESLRSAQRENPGCDIVVFGSFYTVAAAMESLAGHSPQSAAPLASDNHPASRG